MDTPTPYLRKLMIFALALVALFGVGLGAGRLLDPAAPGGEAAASEGEASHGAMDAAHGSETEADPVRGLAVAEDGLRLVLADSEWSLGAERPLRFSVVGEDGATVTDFDLTHTKRMHLIVVRRDLTGFQHLHPKMAADGTWTAPLRLEAPGSYRLFADFSHRGEARTLAADLGVDGDASLAELPPPAKTALSGGGYEVRLDSGDAHPGEEAELRFEVSRDGEPVATEPYLGAGGHLVALREGDLAFLHVHPSEGLRFLAEFPTAGRYRLFLQFKVEGRVETVAFTEVVA